MQEKLNKAILDYVEKLFQNNQSHELFKFGEDLSNMKRAIQFLEAASNSTNLKDRERLYQAARKRFKI